MANVGLRLFRFEIGRQIESLFNPDKEWTIRTGKLTMQPDLPPVGFSPHEGFFPLREGFSGRRFFGPYQGSLSHNVSIRFDSVYNGEI
jgi:hypothetical protein